MKHTSMKNVILVFITSLQQVNAAVSAKINLQIKTINKQIANFLLIPEIILTKEDNCTPGSNNTKIIVKYFPK